MKKGHWEYKGRSILLHKNMFLKDNHNRSNSQQFINKVIVILRFFIVCLLNSEDNKKRVLLT